MNLGELIVELSADTAQLEKSLKQAKKKAYEAASFIEKSFDKINLEVSVDSKKNTRLGKNLDLNIQQIKKAKKTFSDSTIIVKVNDSELTRLNNHLDIKVQHLKEVNRYFNRNPITLKTNAAKIRKDISGIVSSKAYLLNLTINKRTFVEQIKKAVGSTSEVTTTVLVKKEATDDQGNYREVIASLKSVERAIRSQKQSVISTVIGKTVDNTIGSVIRGSMENLGKQSTESLFKGVIRSIEKSVGNTIGSTNLLGIKLGDILSSSIGKKLDAVIVKELTEIFGDLLGTKNIVKEAAAKRAVLTKKDDTKTVQARDQLTLERRESLRSKRDAQISLQSIDRDILLNQAAYNKGSKIRESLQSQAALEDDAQKLAEIESSISEISIILESLTTEEENLAKAREQAIVALEKSSKSGKQASESIAVLSPPEIPKAYKDALITVAGKKVEEKNIPNIVVDDAFLKSQGADAAYLVESNAIKVTEEMFSAINAGNLSFEQLTTLYHELQHAVDFNFGSNFESVQSARRGEILTKPTIPTTTERSEIQPLLSMYSPDKQVSELNAELNARRNAAKKRDESIRQSKSQEYQQTFGVNSTKLNELVNKQLDTVKESLLNVADFAKKNGIKIEKDILGYISEIQDIRENQHTLFNQLLKAQNLELNPEQLNELDTSIERQLNNIDSLTKRLRITQLEAIKKAEEIVKQAQPTKQLNTDNVRSSVEEAKRISGNFSEAYKALKTSLKKGNSTDSNNQAQVLVDNLARAKKDISRIRISLGSDGDMGTTAGNQINQTLSLITRIENTIKRLNNTGKIKVDLSALSTTDVGLNLDKGLSEGIEKNAAVVTKTVEELTSETNETLKKGFGIASPSWKWKVFGLNLLQGLAEGIKNNTKVVLESIQNLFNTTNIKTEKESQTFKRVKKKRNISQEDSKSVDSSNELIDKAARSSKKFDDLSAYVGTSVDIKFRKAAASVNSLFSELFSSNPKIDVVSERFSALFHVLDSVVTGFVAFKGLQVFTGFYNNTLSPFIKDSLQVASNLEIIVTTIKAVSSSSADATASINSLSKQSKELGLNRQVVLEGASRFLSATQDTPLEGATSDKILSNFNVFIRTRNIDKQSQSRALLALGQMVSKGQIQAEELRGQLAEVLPGSYQLFARGLGLTPRQLGQQLKLGNIQSTDIIKFSQQAYAENIANIPVSMDTYRASVDKLDSAVIDLQENVGKLAIPFQKFLNNLSAEGLNLVSSSIGIIIKGVVYLTILLSKPIWLPMIQGIVQFTSTLNLSKLALTGFANSILLVGNTIKMLASQLLTFTAFSIIVDRLRMSFSDLSGDLGKQIQQQTNIIKEYKNTVNSLGNTKPSRNTWDDVNAAKERALSFLPFFGDNGEKLKAREATALKIIENRKNTSFLLNETDSNYIKNLTSDLNQIDVRIDDIQTKIRALIQFNPKDVDGLNALKQEEEALLKARQDKINPIGSLQGSLSSQIEIKKNEIEYLKETRNETSLYRDEVAAYNRALAKSEQELKALEKAQNSITQAVGKTITAFDMMKTQLRAIASDLEDAKTKINSVTTDKKIELTVSRLGGGITSGNLEFASLELNIESLRQQLKSEISALNQYASLLNASDARRVLQSFKIDNFTGIGKVNEILEKAESEKDKYVLQQFIEYRKIRDALYQSTLQLNEAQLSLRNSLIDQSKKIVEYYRSLNKQAQEITQVYKDLVNTNSLNTAKNRLRSAILGYQDSFITQFAESLLQIIDSLNQATQVELQVQNEIDQAKYNYENQVKEAQEMQQSFLRPTNTTNKAMPPVNANITSGFGWRTIFGKSQFHNGIDYGVPVGTIVKAPTSGNISNIFTSKGGGLTVVLSSINAAGQKVEQSFLHLSDKLVKIGDFVQQGQPIAKSGNSGALTTGPHLDYRVKVGGKYVNPLDFLNTTAQPKYLTQGGNLQPQWLKTVASNYGEGDGFHGKKTASGEIFNKNALTTAMNENLRKQLGISWGDRIEVANAQNGKTVVVRVTDSGPYEKKNGRFVPHSIRGLDLSAEAARQIGVSLGEVQFKVLEKNTQTSNNTQNATKALKTSPAKVATSTSNIQSNPVSPRTFTSPVASNNSSERSPWDRFMNWLMPGAIAAQVPTQKTSITVSEFASPGKKSEAVKGSPIKYKFKNKGGVIVPLMQSTWKGQGDLEKWTDGVNEYYFVLNQELKRKQAQFLKNKRPVEVDSKDFKEIKNINTVKSVSIPNNQGLFLIPSLTENIAETSKLLEKQGLKIDAVLGTGYINSKTMSREDLSFGFVRTPQGMINLGTKPVKSAGFITTTSGETKLLDLSGKTPSEVVAEINKLKKDQNVLSAVLMGAAGDVKAKHIGDTYKYKTTFVAFDKSDSLLGVIGTSQSDAKGRVEDARKAFGGKVAKVLQLDGDFFSKFWFADPNFGKVSDPAALTYKNALLLTSKITSQNKNLSTFNVPKATVINQIREKYQESLEDFDLRELKQKIGNAKFGVPTNIISRLANTNIFGNSIARDRAKKEIYNLYGQYIKQYNLDVDAIISGIKPKTKGYTVSGVLNKIKRGAQSILPSGADYAQVSNQNIGKLNIQIPGNNKPTKQINTPVTVSSPIPKPGSSSNSTKQINTPVTVSSPIPKPGSSSNSTKQINTPVTSFLNNTQSGIASFLNNAQSGIASFLNNAQSGIASFLNNAQNPLTTQTKNPLTTQTKNPLTTQPPVAVVPTTATGELTGSEYAEAINETIKINFENSVNNSLSKLNISKSQSSVDTLNLEKKALLSLSLARRDNSRSFLSFVREIEDMELNLKHQNPERDLFAQQLQIYRTFEDRFDQLQMEKYKQEGIERSAKNLLASVKQDTSLRPEFKANVIADLEKTIEESTKIIGVYEKVLLALPELTRATTEKLKKEYIIAEEIREFSAKQQMSQSEIVGLKEGSRGNLKTIALANLMELNLKYRAEVKALDEEIRKESNPLIIETKEKQKRQALISTLRNAINIQKDLEASEKDLEYSKLEKISAYRTSIASEVIKGRDMFGISSINLQKDSAKLQTKLEFEKEKLEISKLGESGNYSSEYIKELNENLVTLNNLKLNNIESEFSELGSVVKGVTSSFRSSFKEFLVSTKGIGESFGDLINSLGKGLIDSLADIASKLMTNALFGWVANLFASGIGAGGGAKGSFVGDVLPNTSFNMAFAGGMVGELPTFGNGGIVGALNKERSLTGRIPHVIVASEGERVLNHKETAIWNKLQGGIAGFASGGVVGSGNGNIASRIGSTTTINVPVSVAVGSDSDVDTQRLSQAVQAMVSDGIRREMRVGGSINRGNPYGR